jgi:hypothetical protein
MAQLTLAELKTRISAAIREEGVDASDAAAAADAIAPHVIAAEQSLEDGQRRIDADLLKKDTYYAISDEKLDLLPTLAKAALSVVTDGGHEAVLELIGLLYRYRTHNIKIDGEEAAVVRALKSAGTPLSAADVAQHVTASGVRLRRPAAQLLKDLESRESGGVVLVRHVNGRWAIGNV